MTKVIWTQDEIDNASKMWRNGQSASVIARAIGRSRNAIIGMMHRVRVKSGAGRPVAVSVASSYAPRTGAGVISVKVPIIQPISSRDRHDAMRMDPVGEDAVADPGKCKFMRSNDTRCCGRDALPGKPWCAPHRAIVYVKSTYNDGGKTRAA